ncbi:MAG: monovalent cation/H(+) antiporter subunit G, partial [Verrucomicrobiota bacterium]|nr:monovalent cation/H(+) antiporter subunit G [Verrucomicrobiota bacterium]
LILAGCIFAVASQGQMSWLLGLKILLIINFVFIGSPTATHAMMDAGERAGAKPWKKKGGDK